MSDALSTGEIEALREKILRQLEDLEVEIKSHVEMTRPIAPDNAIGRLTRMEAINAKSISEASLASARQRTVRLENALKRIGSPGFGVCASCGEPIPLKRLTLIPETTRCVGCMES